MYFAVMVAQKLTECFKEKSSNIINFLHHLASRYLESQRCILGFLVEKWRKEGRKREG